MSEEKHAEKRKRNVEDDETEKAADGDNDDNDNNNDNEKNNNNNNSDSDINVSLLHAAKRLHVEANSAQASSSSIPTVAAKENAQQAILAPARFVLPPTWPPLVPSLPPLTPFASSHESARRDRTFCNITEAANFYKIAIEIGHSALKNSKPIDVAALISAHLESSLLIDGIDMAVTATNCTDADGQYTNRSLAGFVRSINAILCAVDLFDKKREAIAVDVLRELEFEFYRATATLAEHVYSRNAGRIDRASEDAQTKQKAEEDLAAIKGHCVQLLFTFRSHNNAWPSYSVYEQLCGYLRTSDPAWRDQAVWFAKTLYKHVHGALEERETLERQPYQHRGIRFSVYKFALLATGSSSTTQTAMDSSIAPEKNLAKSLAFRAVYKFCKAEASTREYKTYRVSLVAKDYLAFAIRLAPSPVEQWHVDLAMEQRSDAAVDDTLLAALLLCPTSHLINETFVIARVTRACSSRIKILSKRVERLGKTLNGIEANLCFVRDEAAAKISAALAVHGQPMVDLFVDARTAARREFSLASAGSRSNNASAFSSAVSASYSTAAVTVAVDSAAKRVVALAEKERADISRATESAAARVAAKTASVAASEALAKVAAANAGMGDLTCVVCIDKARTICCVPCGHIAMCTGCAAKVSLCPMCRVAVEKKVAFTIS